MWDTLNEPLASQPVCTVCSDRLVGDPDDDPLHPGGAMCGDCFRARAFEQVLWELEAADRDDDPW